MLVCLASRLQVSQKTPLPPPHFLRILYLHLLALTILCEARLACLLSHHQEVQRCSFLRAVRLVLLALHLGLFYLFQRLQEAWF